MRTGLLKSALSLLISLHVVSGFPQILRVATYNIRFDNPADSQDLWKNRNPYVGGLIRLYNIDIFGTQEGLWNQLEDLKKGLNRFDYTGAGRDDGHKKGEYAAIFYNTAVFELLESGTFWLSEDTARPNKGWDAALPRICTWGKFKVLSTDKEFYLFNVHFDHIGERARSESTKLVLNTIRKTAKESPAILTGDLNFDETDPNFAILSGSGIRLW
jgi:endonuclease/exonuclease/phosphatase family metal-dependent hydrolase